MSGPTPLQKRAERKARNQSSLDMNLVALIDIFTILIFFLLTSASGVELLQTPRDVKLPESVSKTEPRETIVIGISATDITVQGRRVAGTDEALATEGDLIVALKAELDALQAAAPAAASTAPADGSPPKGPTVTLMADRDVPYRLLRKVMATAAQSSFGELSFAVQRKALS